LGPCRPRSDGFEPVGATRAAAARRSPLRAFARSTAVVRLGDGMPRETPQPAAQTRPLSSIISCVISCERTAAAGSAFIVDR